MRRKLLLAVVAIFVSTPFDQHIAQCERIDRNGINLSLSIEIGERKWQRLADILQPAFEYVTQILIHFAGVLADVSHLSVVMFFTMRMI